MYKTQHRTVLNHIIGRYILISLIFFVIRTLLGARIYIEDLPLNKKINRKKNIYIYIFCIKKHFHYRVYINCRARSISVAYSDTQFST